MGVEAVSLIAYDQMAAVAAFHGVVNLLQSGECLMDAGKGDDRVFLPRNDHQRFRCETGHDIVHFQIIQDAGDVSAGALIDGHLGPRVTPEGAGWHAEVDFRQYRRAINGYGAAA